MGKGSGVRPRQVSKAEWDQSYDRVFASQNDEHPEGSSGPPSPQMQRPRGREKPS